MNAKRIDNQHHATFEGARQVDEDGNEFWFARDLAPLLDYQDWRNFMQVVEKARLACQTSGREVDDHFGDITRMVGIGSGAKREIADVRLSRYACYPIELQRRAVDLVVLQGHQVCQHRDLIVAQTFRQFAVPYGRQYTFITVHDVSPFKSKLPAKINVHLYTSNLHAAFSKAHEPRCSKGAPAIVRQYDAPNECRGTAPVHRPRLKVNLPYLFAWMTAAQLPIEYERPDAPSRGYGTIKNGSFRPRPRLLKNLNAIKRAQPVFSFGITPACAGMSRH